MKLKDNQLLSKIIRDLFLVAFLLFVCFALAELLKPGVIINYISLEIYLLFLFVLGVVNIFLTKPVNEKSRKLNFLDQLTIILFSILIGVLLIYLTSSIGLLSILIGLVSGIIAYLLIITLYKND